MSAVDLVEEFGVDRTYTRFATGSYVNGKFVTGAESNPTIKTIDQPLTGEEMKMLLEARKTSEGLSLWTIQQIFITDEKAQTKADHVTIGGVLYEIHSVEKWTHGNDLPHYQSIAVKFDGEGAQSA